MQMGDYRLDHLVGFDLHGKTVGIRTGKIGAAFHAWFWLQNFSL
jgi:D-lactate dehydrogenase